MTEKLFKIKEFYITKARRGAQFFATREVETLEAREMDVSGNQKTALDAVIGGTLEQGTAEIVARASNIAGQQDLSSDIVISSITVDPGGVEPPAPERQPQAALPSGPTVGKSYHQHSIADIVCSYCQSAKVVKRGTRQKKREVVQLYLCKDCQRTFTPRLLRGKQYPLPVMLRAISLYNTGYSLEQACAIVRQTAGQERLSASSLSAWLAEHEELLTFHRMRSFSLKMYKPQDMIETATLAHRQLYRFRFHRAKTRLIMEEDFKHYRFQPLREFLELVSSECPHQYFQQGLRASEAPLAFSKQEMIVRGKTNAATRLAALVLRSVKENRGRHEALQQFMLANDSVTVATEVPVYITREDLTHMQTQLGFELYGRKKQKKGGADQVTLVPLASDRLPRLITGHIDILQIRNGLIHILDYKPRAAKAKPIEQLTLYALALSRLTGLRVFHFKCAWFDERDYFEFFPLHAVYKLRRGRRRQRISTREGIYRLNEKVNQIEHLRPVA